MENIQLNSNNITRKPLIYPVTSSDIAPHGKTDESNTITMVLITLGMVALTIAIILKVVTMLVKTLISIIRNQFSWLHFQQR